MIEEDELSDVTVHGEDIGLTKTTHTECFEGLT